MKYHAILASAITSLCFISSTMALASSSANTFKGEQARWFEIEIILFKQKAGKEQGKEIFSANKLTAKKRYALDLLTPYLQPDIASLKQLLPRCGQADAIFPYDIKATQVNLWPIDNSSEQAESEVSNDAINKDPNIDTNIKNVTDSPSMTVTVLPSSTESNVAGDDSQQTTTIIADQVMPVKYTEITVPVYNQYPSDSQSPLCAIPTEFFQQSLSTEQLEHFSIDGFPVKKLITTVDGIEQWRADDVGEITWASDKPYLISTNSLKLRSIANRIKRSRDYAPLLHLGWRQIGETRSKAQAVRLYAGQNLDLNYKQALAAQITQQKTLEIASILKKRQHIQEQLMLTAGANKQVIIDNKVAAIDELSIAEELRQQAKRQQLDDVFQNFELLNELETNIEAKHETLISAQAVKSIVEQLTSDINKEQTILTANNVKEESVATPALQPWYLDGLFKVHLNHYLYINSEVNMVEPTSLANSTQKKSNKHKAAITDEIISFKQDRRVITGEIHYFDHPHIGMIVQIRRFDPTRPAAEAVSQAKK